MKNSLSKKSTVFLSLLLTSLTLAASAARATDSYCGPGLWREVKALARNCQALGHGGKNCGLIRVTSGRFATFYIGDAVYRARMEESANSDGGDLDDLYIDRDDGCQLRRKNIPAFGDILAALAR